jgi:hypothetical protein
MVLAVLALSAIAFSRSFKSDAGERSELRILGVCPANQSPPKLAIGSRNTFFGPTWKRLGG